MVARVQLAAGAGLIFCAVMAHASPSAASDWQYGCRGVLPSGDAPVIIFNRSSLIMLPKAWVKGSLLGAVNDQLLSSSFRATDNNSGLVRPWCSRARNIPTRS